MYRIATLLTAVTILISTGPLVAVAAVEAAAVRPENQKKLVHAALIADVEQLTPGEPFHLGVHLKMEKGWHVYWKNPGDAGLATKVEFEAPEGFEVGPLRWPEPITFTQPGDVTGYGYEDEVLLIAEVTSKAGAKLKEAEFHTKVSWLACKDKCIPGSAELSLTIPAGGEAKPANRELFAKWTKRLNPPAPAFTLTDQAGEKHSLSDYHGKVVVLEWFNPECPFIKRHHEKRSTMADLAAKYKDRDVVWLAVNSTHHMTPEATKQWHEKWQMTFPVLIDRDGTVGRAYGAKTTPHMFVIDESGEIVYGGGIDDDPRGSSDNPRNYVDEALADLLVDRPVKTDEAPPYGCSVKYAKQK